MKKAIAALCAILSLSPAYSGGGREFTPVSLQSHPELSAESTIERSVSISSMLYSLGNLYSFLDTYFLGDIDNKAMEEELVAAMIDSLGDEYSYYIPSDDVEEFDEFSKGSYIGLGLYLTKMNPSYIDPSDPKSYMITIQSPFPGGPADRAGLRPNDMISHIDGEDVSPLTAVEASKKLRGTPGEDITVTVHRGDAVFDVTLRPERVTNPSTSSTMLEGGAGYIRIYNFSQTTADSFKEDLETLIGEGMEKLARDIKALGFRPGLWMAPYGTGNREFYEAHKDWFLHDADGNPIKSWNGVYTLDPTVPEALEHLKNIFRKASREWGYEFFKIDGMSGRNRSYCAHLYERPEIRARFKNPDCPNPFEVTVKAFREGIGDDRIFLACQGHTSGPEASYAEMARTGADIVHPNKPVMWKNVMLQGRCTINQIFTHNISMIADPDTLLVRDLPLEEARVTATIVALPGQLTFFGDKLGGLDPSRMKILQQSLPPAFVRPMSLYPYFSMLPVWNLAVKSAVLGDFNVVAFFNWSDAEKLVEVSAEELGIPAGESYVCREFWTETIYGNMQSPFAFRVPARGVRVVSIRPSLGRPQIVGSDRHIAQTGFEILDSKWDGEDRSLSGKVALVGNFPLKVAVFVPSKYEFDGASASGADIAAKSDNNSVVFTLVKSEGNDSGTAEFKLRFK